MALGDGVGHTYRLLFLDPDGLCIDIWTFQCQTDETAILEMAKVPKSHTAELWRKGLKVWPLDLAKGQDLLER